MTVKVFRQLSGIVSERLGITIISFVKVAAVVMAIAFAINIATLLIILRRNGNKSSHWGGNGLSVAACVQDKVTLILPSQ